MSVLIAHTGDGHINDDTHGGQAAWESHSTALQSVVAQAIDKKVDAFIHAGDGFKNGHPPPEAMLLLRDALMPLAEEGIPIILLDGNHERHLVLTNQRTATTGVAHMLGGVGEVHCVERKPQLVRLSNGIQVACLPWLSKTTILSQLEDGGVGLSPQEGDQSVTKYALDALDSMVEEADTTAPLVMASHITMDDVRLDSVIPGHKRGSERDLMELFAEPILPREHVEDLPFSYVALSHIHARQRMGTKCFYSGSPDRFTMTDADDEKSFNLVTIGDDNTLERVDYLDTDARAMTRIDLTQNNAESRLDALNEGTLVGLELAPGEAIAPPSVVEQIKESGAVLVATKVTPVGASETERLVVPEKTTPRDALAQWVTHINPENIDPEYLADLADGLLEGVQ